MFISLEPTSFSLKHDGNELFYTEDMRAVNNIMNQTCYGRGFRDSFVTEITYKCSDRSTLSWKDLNLLKCQAWDHHPGKFRFRYHNFCLIYNFFLFQKEFLHKKKMNLFISET